MKPCHQSSPLIASLIVCFGLTGAVSAATVLAFEGFNSGSLSGFSQPDGNDAVVADAGPQGEGDFAAFVQLNGGDDRLHFGTGQTTGSSFGSSPAFLGDFAASGANQLSFDFRHGGVGSNLTIRVHLWDSNNNLRATTSQSIGVNIGDTEWQTLTFSLAETDLVAFGSGSIAGILDNVTAITIRNTPITTGGPGSAPELDPTTNYYFDNITLSVVPEPSSALLAGVALLGMMRRRRRGL